jgi:16S rRNA processing protein RimM
MYVPILIIRRRMENIKIGKIVNAVALRGEVKIYNYSDYKERFEEIDRIIVKNPKGEKIYEIENVRYQNNMVIAKLKGVNDRNGAEALKESEVYITEEDLRELPEDTFYIRDLIGCTVENFNNGEAIGTIKDVIQNSAQDIYQVELKNGKLALIPAVEQFVKSVDIEDKLVKIQLIPGLIDEAIEVE